ncbi:MAG: AraC family transcriptional regulator, partial [Saprospiraceae bacterium]
MSKLLSHHYSQRNLTTLIENQSSYNSQYSELHIFETHKVAEKIALKFDTTIIASMLTGKKVMHLKGLPTFKFLPGESVVVPSGEKMIIDFPIATKDNPTQCLALAIDPNKINEIAQN